jgi:fused signal recognition particle receptor
MKYLALIGALLASLLPATTSAEPLQPAPESPMANPPMAKSPMTEPPPTFVPAGPAVYPQPWAGMPGNPAQPWVIMRAPVAMPPGYLGPPPMMMWFVPAWIPRVPALAAPATLPAAATPSLPLPSAPPDTPPALAVPPAAETVPTPEPGMQATPLRPEELAPDLGAKVEAAPPRIEPAPTQAGPVAAPTAKAAAPAATAKPKSATKQKAPKSRRLCWRNGDLVPCK